MQGPGCPLIDGPVRLSGLRTADFQSVGPLLPVLPPIRAMSADITQERNLVMNLTESQIARHDSRVWPLYLKIDADKLYSIVGEL